ncbi:hypothetical protein SALWKB2_0718 [Snodgrassella alvi wkB2]|nr:hypothetical protein SALWKB2_0718 [Snodgrassella alvi wkB2]
MQCIQDFYNYEESGSEADYGCRGFRNYWSMPARSTYLIST